MNDRLFTEAFSSLTFDGARRAVPLYASPVERVIHTCACCKREYTGPEWAQLSCRTRPLPNNGVFAHELRLEFRDCATPGCGNTMVEQTSSEEE
jgi:hypothetical protein